MKRKTWMLLAFVGFGIWFVMRSRKLTAMPAALPTGAALDRAVNEGSIIH